MSEIPGQYPAGKFQRPAAISAADRVRWIETIAATPARMRDAAGRLTETQLDTPYREGGWTARQVIHHVPESHMNAYIRFKLALTENEPTIRPYEQQLWAELPDTRETPIEVSLALMDSLHDRWVRLLRSITPDQWQRKFRHPELGVLTVERNLGLYAWHGKHHVAHVTELRKRNGW